MKSLKEFLAFNSEFDDRIGTYISVKYTEDSVLDLSEILDRFDLPMNVGDFHSTIVYSPKRLPGVVQPSEFNLTGVATVTDVKYLGEVGSEYRAIVLILHSNTLIDRFEYYEKQYGYVHSYDQFIPHVSLTYSPPEDNPELLEAIKEHVLGLELNVAMETIEDLKVSGS